MPYTTLGIAFFLRKFAILLLGIVALAALFRTEPNLSTLGTTILIFDIILLVTCFYLCRASEKQTEVLADRVISNINGTVVIEVLAPNHQRFVLYLMIFVGYIGLETLYRESWKATVLGAVGLLVTAGRLLLTEVLTNDIQVTVSTSRTE